MTLALTGLSFVIAAMLAAVLSDQFGPRNGAMAAWIGLACLVGWALLIISLLGWLVSQALGQL